MNLEEYIKFHKINKEKSLDFVSYLYYLMDKYKFKYEVAKVYLDNMFYIQDNFDDEKLKLLLKLFCP